MSAVEQVVKLAALAGAPRAGKVVLGMARMHWRYFLLGRGRGLAKRLPASTPMKIHVDPASGCNFRCFFSRNPIPMPCAGRVWSRARCR